MDKDQVAPKNKTHCSICRTKSSKIICDNCASLIRNVIEEYVYNHAIEDIDAQPYREWMEGDDLF